MGAYLGRQLRSVGSGNIGYVGGIIAHAKSGSEGANASQVIRCHYAGNMESYQWNAVAVIPIIQSNVYLSGLVERDWNEDTGLYNSYFKRNDIVGKDSAIKPHPNGYVRAWGDWLGLNYSGGEHGPSAQASATAPSWTTRSTPTACSGKGRAMTSREMRCASPRSTTRSPVM